MKFESRIGICVVPADIRARQHRDTRLAHLAQALQHTREQFIEFPDFIACRFVVSPLHATSAERKEGCTSGDHR
jgi:hypothetical protein